MRIDPAFMFLINNSLMRISSHVGTKDDTAIFDQTDKQELFIVSFLRTTEY